MQLKTRPGNLCLEERRVINLQPGVRLSQPRLCKAGGARLEEAAATALANERVEFCSQLKMTLKGAQRRCSTAPGRKSSDRELFCQLAPGWNLIKRRLGLWVCLELVKELKNRCACLQVKSYKRDLPYAFSHSGNPCALKSRRQSYHVAMSVSRMLTRCATNCLCQIKENIASDSVQTTNVGHVMFT